LIVTQFRIASLEKSNDQFPIHLILVENKNEIGRVIGHATLLRVDDDKEGTLVESGNKAFFSIKSKY
jgi:hypothetical protein